MPEGFRKGSGVKPSTKRLELQEDPPHGRSCGFCLPLFPPLREISVWPLNALAQCGEQAPRTVWIQQRVAHGTGGPAAGEGGAAIPRSTHNGHSPHFCTIAPQG